MQFLRGTLFASVLFFGISCVAEAQAAIEPALILRAHSNMEPIRVVVINMSGKDREACVDHRVVALPVGQRVALEVHVGQTVRFVSNTENHLSEAMTIATADAKHIVTIR